MREMKDSGIEWIGEIPKGWKISRIKQLFSEVNDRCENGENYTLLSVSEYYGVAPKSERISDDDMLTHAETLDGYKICKENDLVMNIMLAWKRALGVSEYTGIVSPAYCIYRGKQNMYVKYFHYLFRTDMYANLFKQYSTGIIDSRLRLYPHKFLALKCQVPPIDTQRCIVDYLDRKCSQIDAIIARQQEVIEKLKAYKQSVITEAVTKGLNPNVPMKDSGDDFIGVMPKHWNIAKLGMLFSFLGGYAYNSDSYTSESDNQVIRIGNVKSGYIAIENNPVYIGDEIASVTDKFRINPGSILFTMTGTKGKRDYFFTHLVTEEDCNGKKLFLNQRVGCFIPKESIDAGYYSYLLKENRILDAIFVYETGTANQGNLGIESIRRTKVQLPSKDEQVKIREYLDNCCAKIEGLLTRKSEIIYKLTAYKKSLIYEVVTGKKEV